MTKKTKIVVLAICLALPFVSRANGNTGPGIREPAFAGRFYPGSAGMLKKAVGTYLKNAVKQSGKRPIAIMAPHAGYIYSGQIAADAFNQAAGHDYDVVVILGANHTSPPFAGVSAYPEAGYKTPLGTAMIDAELVKKLRNESRDVFFRESVHAGEHSAEVMVPFVQTLFPNLKILVAIVGSPDVKLCERFGGDLAKALEGRKPLIVASSDLSHYPNYGDAKRVDRRTLEAFAQMDLAGLDATLNKLMSENTPNLSTCACGQAPAMAAISAAKKLGANCGRIVSYANSGDASIGERSRVVGYGAMTFSKDNTCEPKPAKNSNGPNEKTVSSFTAEQKKTLLSFARETIRQALEAGIAPLARGFGAELENRRGAFVTLKKDGRLRGCIGDMSGNTPLCQVVGAMALKAAFADRRFSPVKMEELGGIEIEISVLTPFKEVEGVEDIKVGRDGVLIKKEGRSAVFLPQVAPEQGWTRNEMLDNLCVKAGLPAEGWKKGTRFFTFRADVFGEADFH